MTSEKKNKRRGSAQYLLNGTLRRARRMSKKYKLPITEVIDNALKQFEEAYTP